jgi:hypothetical protein
MSKAVSHSLTQTLVIVATAALFAACGHDGPAEPSRTDEAVATLRTASARYLDLNNAITDGFVFLHGCETRPSEGPVGMVYVHPGRLMDGVIDPMAPDALIYDPGNSRPTLVGVEFAIPYTLWTSDAPPKFLDATFQREDEFGVFGLHAWVWLDNPKGLFAESNPNVTC